MPVAGKDVKALILQQKLVVCPICLLEFTMFCQILQVS